MPWLGYTSTYGNCVALGPPNLTAMGFLLGADDFEGIPGILLADLPQAVWKIPLGKSAQVNNNLGGKIYVPTKYGGKLTITPSQGQVELYYGDGADITPQNWAAVTAAGKKVGNAANPLVYDVPANKHGWYAVRLVGVAATVVECKFTQTFAVTTRPWNFYWWSRKGDYIYEPWGGNGTADTTKQAGSDDVQVVAPPGAVGAGADIIRCGPDGDLQTAKQGDDALKAVANLFDTAGSAYSPLSKYDAARGKAARQWELNNDQSNVYWSGHCLGGAMASILLAQPKATQASGLNEDELEGLWAELGEAAGIYDIDANNSFSFCPAGPPAAGADNTDKYVDELHYAMETVLRTFDKALQSNLRSDGGGATEVWNHAVWKYEAEYVEAPGGDHNLVEVEMTIYANEDHTPPTNDVADRIITYVYRVRYNAGSLEVERNNGAAQPAGQDFISVGGAADYAPYNMVRVTGANWGGDNPDVTQNDVKALDDNN